MQQNFASINTYLQVDHTNPSANVSGGAGQHKQVTFNGSNVPSVPTSPPILFTNIYDGQGNALPGSLAQLFYYVGGTSTTTNNYVSVPSSGSTMLFGGIILKWGIGNLSSFPNGGTTISYAKPFPNACFFAQATIADAGTTTTANTMAYARNFTSPSSFNLLITLRTSLAAPSGTLTYTYIALGY